MKLEFNISQHIIKRARKCPFCGNKIEKIDECVLVQEHETVKIQTLGQLKFDKEGNPKNIILHKSCLNEYMVQMEEKFEDLSNRTLLFEFIKVTIFQIMENDNKQLPNYVYSRLADVRNGSVIKKGILDRRNMSKDGYTYKTILQCFKDSISQIMYIERSKNFKSEQSKFNYIMAMIENKLLDTYKKEQQLNKVDKIQEKIELTDDININDKLSEKSKKLEEEAKNRSSETTKTDDNINFEEFQDLFTDMK